MLTPGNHDSAIRLGFGASLMRAGVHFRTRVPGVGAPVVLDPLPAAVRAHGWRSTRCRTWTRTRSGGSSRTGSVRRGGRTWARRADRGRRRSQPAAAIARGRDGRSDATCRGGDRTAAR
ncbi:hypothetical protein NKG05_11595 [Oerskovia sp. M15]